MTTNSLDWKTIEKDLVINRCINMVAGANCQSADEIYATAKNRAQQIVQKMKLDYKD